MELMSPLLLCTLAALFPQALGYSSFSEINPKSKPAKFGIEKPMSKMVWLKRKSPSDITLDMVLEYLGQCNQCYSCMACINKALTSISKPKTIPPKSKITGELLLNDILVKYNRYKVLRNRRETNNNTPTNTKMVSKNVTVTKYNMNGQVYALEVREENSNTDTEDLLGLSACQVYSVKKYHPCDSPKAESIFTSGRKKAIKRSKKHSKTPNLATVELVSQSPAPRDKTLAESFMTSIEELY